MRIYPVMKSMIAAATLAGGVLAAPAQATDAPRPQVEAGKQADQYYSPARMAAMRDMLRKELGATSTYYVLMNQLEAQFRDGKSDLYWNGQAWYGGDINKLLLKSEGAASFDTGKVDDAELQALWSHAISPFWDLNAGVRQDFAPDGRTYAAFGVQGLAPYWFEVDLSGFVSTKGEVTARAEAEYESLLTQRLILQPRVEANFAFQDIPDRDLASGLNSVDAGLRLRYEIKRQVAPYVGIEWQYKAGGTADIARLNGEPAAKRVFVAGLRLWF